MKHKVIQNNKLNLLKKLARLCEARNTTSQDGTYSREATLPASQPSESVLHHGEKNNSSNPFSYQENSSRQRAQRFKTLVSGSKQPWRSSTFLNKYIILQKRIRLVGSLALVLLLTLTAFTLRPVSVSTDFAEATANPATTTLTMTTGYDSASLDITPSSTTGTFASSSDDELAKFTVSTNNITGYNLSISHGSSTTPAPLTNEDLSTDLASLPAGTSITDSEFNTSTYVGYYGYKPSKLNSVLNSNYIPAPTTSSTTINQTQCANNTASCNTASDEYTIALGANIDYTKSAGTYTNTFILTAVANNVPYRINYLDDTSDSTVAGLPAAEANSTATASGFTLASTTPTRTNYSFIGWCDGTVTHNSTDTDTCAGTTYQAGSTYTFSTPSATSTNVANLYAMWKMEGYTITFKTSNASSINFNGTDYTNNQTVAVPAGTYQIYGNYATKYAFSSWSLSGSGSFGNQNYQLTTFTVSGDATITLTGQSVTTAMQGLSASSCTTTPKPVYDTRDNEVYWIQKLADGNCWMLDNLRLGGTSTISLTTSNTHVNTTKTLPASGTANFDSTNGYTNAAINIDSKNKVNTDTTENWGYGSGKYGVYYNFCAASALTICTSSNSSNASYDVCPKGWKMPTGGSTGQYQSLCDTIKGESCGSSWTDDGAFHTALSTPLSGLFVNGSASGQGSVGDFWSSTRNSTTGMYRLRVDSSTVNPQGNGYRFFGRSVRCILDAPTIADATYMQDITSEMVANTAGGATATLRDIRDNQDYTVAKINGNLWMTRNLAIGCNGSGSTYGSSASSKSLTSTYSNVSTTWSTPTAGLSNGNNYTTPYMTCSSTYGAWYNYAAASAGTITGSSNSTVDTYNICPKGWTLPTSTQQSGITSYSSAFSPVTGGYYNSGSLSSTGYGYWWSATANNASSRYFLYWDGSSLNTNRDSRNRGFYVRCVRSS